MRRRSGVLDAAYAVLTAPDTEPAAFPPTAACDFLGGVVDGLGDLAAFCTLEINNEKTPRLVLDTSAGRTYALTLPDIDGPFEVWASVELPADDPTRRFVKLREREEVLAQALHTHRLAWHRNDGMGWIGLPVAIAADAAELDPELAVHAADALRRLFFTIERICTALDERAAARAARRSGPGRQVSAHRTSRDVRGTREALR